MHSPHQPCWIGAGLSNLHEARVLEMTARHVKVHLNEVTSIPEECNLFFTPDFREWSRSRIGFPRGLWCANDGEAFQIPSLDVRPR
jgi:hypothetical protein